MLTLKVHYQFLLLYKHDSGFFIYFFISLRYIFIDVSLSVHHLNASLYFSSLQGTLKPINLDLRLHHPCKPCVEQWIQRSDREAKRSS